MKTLILAAVCTLSLPFTALAQNASLPPATAQASPTDAAPLDLIIPQVKAAIDMYQASIGSGPDALPPLTSAEFDFKTTTATVAGFSINLLVFKIGASHEQDVVNDATFTYKLKTVELPKTGLQSTKHQQPVSLTEALASTIQQAAKAVKASRQFGKLTFSQFAVTVQYGIKWDGNIGVNVPIQFVTLGLNGDKNKNSVQSVKLVFGQ